MDEFTIKFYYIFKFILLLLALFGAFYIVKDIINVITGRQSLRVMEKLTEKDVKIITVENSKDIHELTKRIEKLEEVIKCK